MPNAGWRGAGGGSKGGSGGSSGGSNKERSWRDSSNQGWDSGAPSDKRKSRYAARSFGVLVAALLMALGIWMLTWLNCGETHVIVAVARQTLNPSFPPNSFAPNDADALQSLDKLRRLKVESSDAGTDFKKILASVADKEKFVLYLNRLGARDTERAYVMQVDAKHETGFVSLSNLWDALGELPAEQLKVVLLDVCRFESDWRLGVLDNAVLDDLPKAVAGIENLVVITSCAPGEVSYTSAHLGGGQSVFGYYVFRALAGEADRDGDSRVTVRELYEFIHVHSRNWVNNNRDRAGQHALIIPADSPLMDSELLAVGSGVVSNLDAKPRSIADAARSLQTLWEARDKLRNGTIQFDAWSTSIERRPLAWRQFTFRLMRAEELLWAREVVQAEELIDAAKNQLVELQRDSDHAKPTYGKSTDKLNQAESFIHNTVIRRISSADKDEPDASLAAEEPKVPEDQLRALFDAPELLPTNVTGLSEVATTAVETRKLAEQAANQTLYALSWIRKLITQADEFRRSGEDDLFAGRVTEATANLEQARERYRTANQVSTAVHAAHVTLNHLLTELPDLAFWASERWVVPETNRDAVIWRDVKSSNRSRVLELHERILTGELDVDTAVQKWKLPSALQLAEILPEDKLQRIEVETLQLFAEAASLATRLSQAKVAEFPLGDEEAWYRTLQNDAQSARDKFIDIDKRLGDAARQFLKENRQNQSQQVSWRHSHEYLQYASLPADLREELRNLREVFEFTLNDNTIKIETGESNTDKNWKTSVPDAARMAVEAAQWRALWINHVLTLGIHGSQQSIDLWNAWKSIVVAEDRSAEQRKELLKLGRLIRQTWQYKRERSKELVNRAGKSTQSKRDDLFQASRISRTLHGHDANALDKFDGPAMALQTFVMAELCTFHAQRFADDFWASVGRGEPWFDLASKQAVDAANALAGSLAPIMPVNTLQDDISAADQQRESRRMAHLEGSAFPVRFGLEGSQQLILSLRKKGEVPSGNAAVWVDKNSVDPLTLLGNSRQQVTTSDGGEAKFTLKKPVDFEEGPGCGELTAKLKLVFRGHQWEGWLPTVKVDACRKKGVAFHWKPADVAGEIMVEGDDRRSVMFILDCSNSMGAEADPLRFNKAVNTLREALSVLRTQHENDDRRDVGLTVYGHRVQQLRFPNGTWDQVRVRSDLPKRFLPVPADGKKPYADIQRLRLVGPLTADHYKDILEDLTLLKPFGNTPLIGSIQQVVKQYIPNGGTIVAITDGADTQDVSPALLAKRVEVLKDDVTHHPQGVEISIVGFAVTDGDKTKLSALAKDTGGAFFDAPDGKDLANALGKALMSRPYTISSQVPGFDTKGSLGTVTKELQVGTYTVSFAGDRPLRLELSGGERLVYKLERGSLLHRKDLVPQIKKSVSAVIQGAVPDDHPVQFSYRSFLEEVTVGVNNSRSTARFLFAVDHKNPALFVRRPEEIFFEVHPQVSRSDESKKLRQMEWQLEPRQSIPTWRVTVHDWPKGAKAEVRAWWKMKRTQPDVETVSLTSEAGLFRLTENLTLELAEKPRIDIVNRTVTIIAKSPGRDALTESDPVFSELTKLRMELGTKSTQSRFEPHRFPFTRVFRPDERSLEFTYSFEEGFDPSQCLIGVTTWTALRTNAVTVKQPLVIQDDLSG